MAYAGTRAGRARFLLILSLAGTVGFAVAIWLSAGPAGANDKTWSWPLGNRSIAGDFDRPDSPYGAGHRGIDLPGRSGDAVRSVAPGRVVFAGEVAGVGVVTIEHGSERSTYQPIRRLKVRKADAVKEGQLIGSLDRAGSHCSTSCLHLGRLIDEQYLDPSERLRGGMRFRLVDPDGPIPEPPAGEAPSAGTGPGTGKLVRPVPGPITSAFGMRVHPITGVRKLHDATDFGAPCGTSVRAGATGRVVSREFHPAYGMRVVLQHKGGTQTNYNHMSAFSVQAGQRVKVGDEVGKVGTTGMSTGCHLHFGAVQNGKPTDPAPLL